MHKIFFRPDDCDRVRSGNDKRIALDAVCVTNTRIVSLLAAIVHVYCKEVDYRPRSTTAALQ